ncbi:serine/threonine protein kinase and signal transduction histidine kinase [Scytonema sp. HK-05]|uniref:trifunctional serine/threonine-protein kinase/ATP-binding protein/sensor histidine kinase n=1 Tax=Scytonema sp. HK-05 TaxID=1137095 RepID=UPI0009375516|nr:ATP-binding sensor histidine kinase [Scytonema sp. HK-05]OKH59321.1 serine/threonine protein kinase [Scytonema sp. HK-05]BAY46201.1 serine/threonine protein kinase and signal transduction histidine kinase [Scytonema sp. HK-05]
MDILGYQARELLYESDNSLVYRAYREEDNQRVILKMLKQAYPPPKRIAEFHREYEITKNLNLTGVVNAYSLKTEQHRWVMVLEDFGGESLQRVKQNREFTLNEFLSLAIEVVGILGQVHDLNVIHKDINPSNIVWNQTTGQLKLIDFGISTELSQEATTFRNPNLLEGTLAYISPEQTGRMNRAIDYRTDFYSLGVTFYELLTGQLPFSIHDALELIHCHIARQSDLPHEHRPDIPLVISEIVLKLMAKNAEARYQTAYGLKADLEECLRQWQTLGQIHAFPLGQQDVSGRFQIPQKLYGREKEIDTILAAFVRVACPEDTRVSQGASEMMLVTGYSGIGKSALVQEVYKPITEKRGYFTSGKFDQYQRDIPYVSLVQAFRSLIRQLLTESQAQIENWREKLLAALGSNGQVIVDVIPEVELIIGPQPAVPELAATEAQNRFNFVFQNFIKVFTQASHPLVLFLDDLQWADGASLKLIELLMTAVDSSYLLLIAAYRDNEVSATHPLLLTLDEIRKRGATVHQIVLAPLTLPDVTQFTADALNCAPEKARPLSELVLAKTQGNPFFINEFLKSLYTEELLKFDFQKRVWQWNLAQIQLRNITDNVVELMADKLRKLGEQTQQVLRLAACIGNQFELQTLGIIYEKSPQATAADLWTAMEEGLVLPLGDGYKLIELNVKGLADEVTVEYKFTHDRIQQAAYSLIPESQKQDVHSQVGRLLLRNTSPQEQEQKIFTIVNQLNQGRDRLKHQTERDELAQLNLIAGRKAKASVAYQSAFNYLQIGIKLLNSPQFLSSDNKDGSWQRQYDLTLTLYLEAAEAACLSDRLEEVEQWTEVILQKAKTLLDKVKAYEIKIQAYYGRQQSSEAMKIGLQALQFLGVEIPKKPNQADLVYRLEETKAIWAGQNIEDLIDLPKMTDAKKLATMPLLFLVLSLASVGFPELFPFLILGLVNISLKFGTTSFSAPSYAVYGIVLCGAAEDIEAGYQFNQLALKLLKRLDTKQFEAKTVYVFNTFVRHWKEHTRESLKPFLEVHQCGLETGDMIWSCTALFMYALHAYWIGQELEELEREIVKYSEAINQHKQELSQRWIELVRQPVLNLIGKTQNPCLLVSQTYDEKTMLSVYQKVNDRQAMGWFYLNKLVLCYLFQEYQQAIENATKAEEHLGVALGLYTTSIFNFYYSLALLAVFPVVQEAEQPHILEKVDTNQKKMENWAHHAPMNFLHKFYLVEAERARVLGKDSDAREYYDRAITLAQENEYLNEEALAYELAGKFYLARNQNHVARHYLQDAHYAYQRWGAVAKVKDLEARYPQFLANTSTDSFATRLNPSTTNTGTTTSDVLDLNSILQASQSLSGEIILDKLLKQLMKLVIENAGAQKGFMLLERKSQWVIEAQGSVNSNDITILQSIPVDSINPDTQIPLLSPAIINYVARTQENVVLNDATNEGQFTRDPYIIATKPKSILCTPLLHQGKLSGILYLENNLTTGAFTSDRVEVLKILSAQAAISIENSRLYEQLEDYNRTLEQKVEVRTQELQEKNQELASILQKLKATQAQIIAQEKLASLGALTAGIAHEIKNPLNFVNNFAELSVELTQELLEEISNQQDRLDSESREYIEEILNDLKQNAKKINEHGKRADNIVHGMLMHSRGQTGDRQETDINAMLAEAISLTYQGMRAKDASFNIVVETDYDDNLGLINVVPQNISRALINIINNACYAAYKKRMRFQREPEHDSEEFSPTLSVSTKDLGKQVEIHIRDNGEGIPQKLRDQIFNPFFTTKPPGEGTGLGLSITHDIIVQQHQGKIRVESEVNSYTLFIITLPKSFP